MSHRGPLILLVLWAGSLSLSVIWFQTSLVTSNWPFALTQMVLNICYGFTLLPGGKSERLLREVSRDRVSPINTYHRLSVDGDDEIYTLGSAQDGFNFISRLFFQWVSPLIAKARLGKLKKNEDLFDLPERLNVKKLFDSLQRSLRDGRKLFGALHRSFGFEFYSIGLLRLLSDLSNFAGPLLLGGLLRSGVDTDAKSKAAYYYAAGKSIFMLFRS